jgi:predicted AAA+ superfamily ATPase
MLERSYYNKLINNALDQFSIVAILGPRQCGKTTIARSYFNSQTLIPPQENYFDLEDPQDILRLENPQFAFSQLKGMIVIDEIQKKPDLFPLLRVLVDEQNNDRQFLILGSASRDLIQQSSETLAGRIDYIELTPFSMSEVSNCDQLWLRGGFPLAYLANDEMKSHQWLRAYVRTYLEQDLPMLGIDVATERLRRFWLMLTHYHGGIFNASEIGRSLGVSHNTIRHYVDILSSTFMVRQLQPWHENIRSRQVKSPKVFFRDTGILHYFLDIKSKTDLLSHPKLGASWEGFALEQTIHLIKAQPEECYFWATHGGAECDLVIVKGIKKWGYEFKFSDQPKPNKSMYSAIDNLGLEHLYVIKPRAGKFCINNQITVLGLEDIQKSEAH